MERNLIPTQDIALGRALIAKKEVEKELVFYDPNPRVILTLLEVSLNYKYKLGRVLSPEENDLLWKIKEIKALESQFGMIRPGGIKYVSEGFKEGVKYKKGIIVIPGLTHSQIFMMIKSKVGDKIYQRFVKSDSMQITSLSKPADITSYTIKESFIAYLKEINTDLDDTLTQCIIYFSEVAKHTGNKNAIPLEEYCEEWAKRLLKEVNENGSEKSED